MKHFLKGEKEKKGTKRKKTNHSSELDYICKDVISQEGHIPSQLVLGIAHIFGRGTQFN